MGWRRGFLRLSLSQPLPQPVLLAVEPQPQCFFPNYQLTKNLSPKTDNICIDCLYQQYQSIKGANHKIIKSRVTNHKICNEPLFPWFFFTQGEVVWPLALPPEDTSKNRFSLGEDPRLLLEKLLSLLFQVCGADRKITRDLKVRLYTYSHHLFNILSPAFVVCGM